MLTAVAAGKCRSIESSGHISPVSTRRKIAAAVKDWVNAGRGADVVVVAVRKVVARGG